MKQPRRNTSILIAVVLLLASTPVLGQRVHKNDPRSELAQSESLVQSLYAEILSRLSRLFFSLLGCPEGMFLFSEGTREIMKADELPWRKAILACRSRINE